MNILDLNHIEAVEGAEVIGGRYGRGFGSRSNFNQGVNINVNERIKKNIDVASSIKVDRGTNTALVDGQSTASGKTTFTEVIGLTDTTPGSSISKVVGISFTGK